MLIVFCRNPDGPHFIVRPGLDVHLAVFLFRVGGIDFIAQRNPEGMQARTPFPPLIAGSAVRISEIQRIV